MISSRRLMPFVPLMLLVFPGASPAGDEGAARAQVLRFYSSVANAQFGATWELLSRNLARDTNKDEYIKSLAQFFKGTKLSFEVGVAHQRMAQQVEVTSDLRLEREADRVVYPVRHTTIWVYEKERNGWFFDGERGQPLVTVAPPR